MSSSVISVCPAREVEPLIDFHYTSRYRLAAALQMDDRDFVETSRLGIHIASGNDIIMYGTNHYDSSSAKYPQAAY